MRRDDRIGAEVLAVRRERRLEVVQRALLVRGRDGAHGLEAGPLVAHARFAVDDGRHLVRIVHHDLRQQHVLEAVLAAWVANRVKVLERLIKVREGRLEVLLLRVQRELFLPLGSNLIELVDPSSMRCLDRLDPSCR